MAASIKVCDQFLLVASGRRFLTQPFSASDPTQTVVIPDLSDVKTSVGTKKSKTEENRKDGGKGWDMVDKDSPNKILVSAISPDCTVVVVCDNRKFLHVYRQVNRSWQHTSSRCVSKRSTALSFTQDGQSILVAGTSGDVISVPTFPPQCDDQEKAYSQTNVKDMVDVVMKDDTSGLSEKAVADSEEQEGMAETEPCGTLQLGHLSMLLDMMLILKDKLIVTCDRDEKVRLSHFPDAYNIESYCLGHTAFVSSLAFDSKFKVIMSGSGDCTLRLWSLQGKQLLCRNVLSDISNSDTSIPDEESKAKPNENMDQEEEILDKTEQKTDSSDNLPGETVQTKDRPAIRQLCYCESCSLLCAAMYRCSTVLVYKVNFPSEDSNRTGPSLNLCLVSSLTGPGDVVSMCVHQCVLWLLRQKDSSLKLHAHKMNRDVGILAEIVPSAASESPEELALHSILTKKEFLEDIVDSSDLISNLWKCPVPDYIEQYKERKRQRLQQDAQSNNHSTNKAK